MATYSENQKMLVAKILHVCIKSLILFNDGLYRWIKSSLIRTLAWELQTTPKSRYQRERNGNIV